MTVQFRSTVRDAPELIKWSLDAQPGQAVTYHIGNLSADRATSQPLHLLAETVMLLTEHDYIRARQSTMRLPLGTATWYSAVKTEARYAPRSILTGECDAITFRALEAVANRDQNLSAARAICTYLGCPEQLSLDLLALLWARKWVEAAESRGWNLTGEGRRILS